MPHVHTFIDASDVQRVTDDPTLCDQCSKHQLQWVIYASLAFQAGCRCRRWRGTRQLMERDAKDQYAAHLALEARRASV